MQAKGIAARAGRWSTENRKKAIWGWLAFVVIALVIGGGVGSKELEDADTYQGESGRAEQALVDAGLDPPAGETVMIKSETLEAGDRQFDAAIADVERRIDKVAVAENVQSGTISKDRHAALVTFDVKGDPETAGGPLRRRHGAGEGRPGGQPAVRDQAVRRRELDEGARRRVHGGPAQGGDAVAAGDAPDPAGRVRRDRGGRACRCCWRCRQSLATMGLVALPSHIFPIDDATASVIVLIGMAVGVDYALFYMRREREERAAGHDAKTAVQRAAATSGRAVLISGLTVMTAMAGMFFSGDKTFIGIGLGALIVVGVAMIGSLTVLPAMMAWLGDRVEKGRVPYFGRRRAAARESRMWGAIVDRVLKRPLVSAAVARRDPDRADDPGVRPEHRAVECVGLPAGPAGDPVLQRHQRGVPGQGDGGDGRHRGRRRPQGRGRAGDRRAEGAGARERPDVRADRDAHLGRPQRRRGLDPAGGRRWRPGVEGRAGDAPRRDHPGHGRAGRRRSTSRARPPRARTRTRSSRRACRSCSGSS